MSKARHVAKLSSARAGRIVGKEARGKDTGSAFLPGDRAVFHSLVRMAEFNGRMGTVQGWDEKRLYYRVRTDDGYTMGVLPKYLTLLDKADANRQQASNPKLLQPQRKRRGSAEEEGPAVTKKPKTSNKGPTLSPMKQPAALLAKVSSIRGRIVETDAPRKDTGSAFLPGDRAVFHSLVQMAEFNGRMGTVQGWDDKQLFYKVRTDDGYTMGGLPTYLAWHDKTVAKDKGSAFLPGDRAVFHSLVRQTEFNGRMGTVQGWDENRLYYKVRTDDGYMLGIFPKYLAFLHKVEPKLQCAASSAFAPHHVPRLGTEERWDDNKKSHKMCTSVDCGKELPSKPVSVEIPDQYRCPLTLEVMEDPVVGKDGHSYERRAIEGWLEKHTTSPMTNEALFSADLCPNHSLKSLILEWKESTKGRG